MKKLISILMAVMMMAVLCCTAMADTKPEPEGGKKFNNDWAVAGGLVTIVYEEEGYRVAVDLLKQDSPAGTSWEYACYYHEETDSLVSVSSSRTEYTVNLDNGEQSIQGVTYEGMDDEKNATEFTIDADGKLIWKDGREDAGKDLKFTNIGKFEGMWKNEKAETGAEFTWLGLYDPDKMVYTVYIQRGSIGNENYTLFLMEGTYDPATGKLTANGTCTLFTKNASGEYTASDDGESYDAIFSMLPDGKLLFETDNGIELEYDIMGHPQG